MVTLLYINNKNKQTNKNPTSPGCVNFITRHSVGWISPTQLILALALFSLFSKLFLFIALLCSAASITLCYQNTSMEVVLPF